MGDDPREPGQASGIHFNPLMEVVPASTPSPIMKVILINPCLERREGCSERPLGQDDEDRSCLETERKGERTREGNEEGNEEKPLRHELLILSHERELSSIYKLGISQYSMSSSRPV